MHHLLNRLAFFAAGPIISLLLTGSPAVAQDGPTREKSPVAERLAKCNRLWSEAQKLQADGKLAEAIAAAEHVLEIEQQEFGKDREEVAVSLVYLCQLGIEAAAFDTARRAAHDALSIRE